MDTQTAEKQTQHPTLPPASVLKAAKVLAYYAVWYLDDFLLSEKAGVWITPMTPSRVKKLKFSSSSYMEDEPS